MDHIPYFNYHGEARKGLSRFANDFEGKEVCGKFAPQNSRVKAEAFDQYIGC